MALTIKHLEYLKSKFDNIEYDNSIITSHYGQYGYGPGHGSGPGPGPGHGSGPGPG